MSIYFTSDLHLGHEMVARLRGFSDADGHDMAVLNNLAEAIRKKDDQLWVLGDLALAGWRRALVQIGSLPGRKHLIIGNHDMVFPGMRRDSHKHFREYMETFDSVQMMAKRRVAGQTVYLSHFPYAEDHTAEPRWMNYRLRDTGELLLHGHTHSTAAYTSIRELHVGLDAFGLQPVPLEFVEGWVKTVNDVTIHEQ